MIINIVRVISGRESGPDEGDKKNVIYGDDLKFFQFLSLPQQYFRETTKILRQIFLAIMKISEIRISRLREPDIISENITDISGYSDIRIPSLIVT